MLDNKHYEGYEHVVNAYRDRLYDKLEDYGISPPSENEDDYDDPVMSLARVLVEVAEIHVTARGLNMDDGPGRLVFLLAALAMGNAAVTMLRGEWDVEDLIRGLDN